VNPAKALRNIREHNISFERAATVFLDPSAMSIFDDVHKETCGEAGAKMRLISARRADRKETAQYRGLER
jgi:uncharacterized DUF497 family protein